LQERKNNFFSVVYIFHDYSVADPNPNVFARSESDFEKKTVAPYPNLKTVVPYQNPKKPFGSATVSTSFGLFRFTYKLNYFSILMSLETFFLSENKGFIT
jgi:hypothetical protein